MNVIGDHDWEVLAREFQNAEPFPSICIDQFLTAEVASEVSSAYPNFAEAKGVGQEFKTVNEKKKIQICDPNAFPSQVAKLHKALADPQFIKNMEVLSGIKDLQFDPDFEGGGMHLTRSSGILDVHVDFNYSEKLKLYRRLNILIYLNEEWEENWGGRVELWDKDVKKCVKHFVPVQNRCVIFATSGHSFHGVTAVNSPEGVARKSFAIYLYSKEPSVDKFGENHGTVFKARPNEKVKKYWSMPVESLKNTAIKGLDQVKSVVKKVAKR